MKHRLRILVTAGPTRERIDPVRYLSSPSSGRMGFAVAARAARRGHRVTLISGPVDLAAPAGVRVARVETAAQMARAVDRAFASCDAVVMTAAVADYAPARTARAKIKKSNKPLVLRLVPTQDILAGLGRRKGSRVLVGFALETGRELRNAREKLMRKNLDLIVANRPESFGGPTIRAALLFRDGRVERLPVLRKDVLAGRLVREVELACRCSKA